MTQPSKSTLPDHYATLQVSSSASQEVITSSYRALARKYHPDTNPSPDATARMKEINVAYDVLSDSNKRAEYDRQRVAATQPPLPRTPPRPASKQQQQPIRQAPRPQQPPIKQAPRTPPPRQQAPRSQPAQAARPPMQPSPAPSPLSSISNFLASPAFSTFIIAFIIALAVQAVIAELFGVYDFEWLIIPISLLVAVVAMILKRR